MEIAAAEANGIAIVTSAAESTRFAEAELRQILPEMPPLRWLGAGSDTEGGVALATPGDRGRELVERHARRRPVFVRHIAPGQVETSLRADATDLERLAEVAAPLGARLDPSRTFAVQTRVLSEGALPYRRVQVNEALSTRLEQMTGATMECRVPEQVVSVLCTPDRAWLGVSRTEQNRSAWPGGRHRFRREEEQVSRAEFKLLEAINVFALELPERGVALDMGAAPGGWTRVLRQHGLKVVAVDPGDLDSRLKRDSGITHVAARIQEYLPRSPRSDLIVNDLKMDARASIALMLLAGEHLCPGGLGVMTLKLPRAVTSSKAMLAHVRQDLHQLSRGFEVLEARQLYHNRSEITVALRRPVASSSWP